MALASLFLGFIRKICTIFTRILNFIMKKLYTSFILTIAISLLSGSAIKAAASYFYTGAGAAVTLLSSWNSLANGTGTVPTTFGTAGATWNLNYTGSLSISSATWALASTAQLTLGDGTNGLNFTIASGGLIGALGAAPKVVVANNATLTINVSVDNLNTNAPKTVFNSGSTVIYASSGNPKSFANPYYNIILNTPASLSSGGFSATNLTVNSALDLATSAVNVSTSLTMNANITLSGGALNLGGTISGSGSIIGDLSNFNSSALTFTGSGAIGTLKLASPFQIANLNIALGSAASSITLGSDVIVDGGSSGSGLALNSGLVNLNGHTLSAQNSSGASSVTFGGATIGGSSTSALSFSPASISGSLLMDASSNTLKSLYLNDGGNGLTLTLGNALNIADSVSAASGTIASGSGNLTLVGTAALRGRIGMMGATGAISGSIKSQVYFGRTYTGWRQMGVGGTSGNTLSSWDSQFPMTCTGCTYDPTSMSPAFYSVQGWDETTDDYVTTLTSGTSLTPGTGYWVYLGTGSSNTNPITITTTGAAVTGQVNVTITSTDLTGDPQKDDFNLIANPYASPISWDKFFAFNGQGGNLQGSTCTIWDADTQSEVLVGSGGIIPAGQGFYVQLFGNSPPTTMVFDESMKTQDNTGSSTMLMRTAAQQSISGFELHVDGSLGDADQTYFRFDPNASSGFDRLDAHKMFSTPNYQGLAGASYSHYTSISSLYQDHKFIVNELPVLTNSLSVPVMVRVMATGSYTISVDNIQNYSSCTILKDNLTGTYHDLAQSPYVCTINDTTSAPRFELIMCAMSSPVSVKELNATASKISVYQDEISPLVTTHFEQSTKATISVFNVVGQQLVKDLQVEGTDTKTRLNIDSHNEVLLIRVKTDKETVTTKIITH